MITLSILGLMICLFLFVIYRNHQNFLQWREEVLIQLGPDREHLLTDDQAVYYYGEHYGPITTAWELIGNE